MRHFTYGLPLDADLWWGDWVNYMPDLGARLQFRNLRRRIRHPQNSRQLPPGTRGYRFFTKWAGGKGETLFKLQSFKDTYLLSKSVDPSILRRAFQLNKDLLANPMQTWFKYFTDYVAKIINRQHVYDLKMMLTSCELIKYWNLGEFSMP